VEDRFEKMLPYGDRLVLINSVLTSPEMFIKRGSKETIFLYILFLSKLWS
jgi:hypothetical protein